MTSPPSRVASALGGCQWHICVGEKPKVIITVKSKEILDVLLAVSCDSSALIVWGLGLKHLVFSLYEKIGA